MKTKLYSRLLKYFATIIILLQISFYSSCSGKSSQRSETTTVEETATSEETTTSENPNPEDFEPNSVGSSAENENSIPPAEEYPEIVGATPNDNASPIEGSSPSVVVENPSKENSAIPDKSTKSTFDSYKVVLATDEKVFRNQKCELKIWIGAENIEVTFSKGMISDQTSIPATIGQYAKITPYAPDFDVSPAEMKCVKIDPSGSEVRFTLTPKASGKFKVSANIELFENDQCSGVSVPKTAKTVTVNVEIDTKHIVTDGLGKMGTVVWDKFLSFWVVFITLLFAALLFVIRRFIKAKTGYEDKVGEN